MAVFTLVRTVPVPADLAWARVLDLRAHGEVIPLTSVRLAQPAGAARDGGTRAAVGASPGAASGARARRSAGLAAGSRLVARTAVGRVGFDDPMVVEVFRPPRGGLPGFARIRKEGKVIRGWIDLVVVRAARPGSASVTWAQQISVRGVPRVLDPIVAAGARAAYGWALDRLLSGARQPQRAARRARESPDAGSDTSRDGAGSFGPGARE